ncbi:MAG: hypothetical protein K2F81_01000 [Ruminococcus sp.]|nr:hypothetical protein [Ruminococcus sp.]
MKIDNLQVQLAVVIPFGRSDKNGVVYSREAIEKAVNAFAGELPIIYRDNNTNKDGVVIGNTIGETCSVLWDDKYQVCEVIVNGNVYYGGTECIVNEIKDGIVTDFDIVSVGLSKEKNIYEKYAKTKDSSLCDNCIHSGICRFEVPVGETCEHHIIGG